MSIYYGISQSADSRELRTVVRRLGHGRPGLTRAREWVAQPTRHCTLYRAYEMPARWRAPSTRALIHESVRISTGDCPRSAADALASLIERDGARVTADDEVER